MKLFWTETAKQDLQAIRRYIAADNPTAAKRWVERLRERARNALHAPRAGRKVPEFSRGDIRELIEGNCSKLNFGLCPSDPKRFGPVRRDI